MTPRLSNGIARAAIRAGLALLAALAPRAADAQPAPGAAAPALAAAEAIEDEALLHKSRGRHAEALDGFLRAAEALVDAGSPGGELATPDPFVAARTVVYLLLADQLALRADRLSFFRERLDALAPRVLDPLLRGRVDELRRGLAQRLGDFAAAAELTRALGFVTDWLVIGPFDNERGGGFAATHPPERGIDAAARYPGKRDEVAWRRLPVAGRSYVDLDTLLHPNDETIAFALTHVHSEEDVPACARFGTDESFKLWVNDRLVASRDARRPCRFDQEAAGFFLRRGWNRVLLLVGERTGEWGFSFRLTTPEGAPLEGLRVEPDPAAAVPLAAEPGAAPPEARAGELGVLAAHARANSGDARSLYHLALLHTIQRVEDEGSTAALDAAREAARLEPGRTAYAYMQALASVRPASMSPEREENDKRRLLERVLEQDPGNAEAAFALALYYEQSLSNHEKAESLAKRALASNPSFVEARLFGVGALRRRGFEPQADEALAALSADERVGTAAAVDLDRARRAAARRDTEAAETILRGLIARDRANSAARRELLRLLLATARPADALELLAGSLAVNPYDLAARFLRADVLESMDRLDEAAAEVEEAGRIAPDAPEPVKRLAKLEHRRGRDAEARALFERAVKIDPNDRDLQRYVEFLEESARPFEEAYPFDRDAAIASARAVPAEGNEAFVTASQRTLIKVHRDGTASRYVHRIYKVQSEEGARTLDTVPVPFAIGEQRVRVLVNRVLRADGTEREGRTANASGDDAGSVEYRTYALRSIDLPPLAAGDLVEVAYRLDDARQSFFGDYFGLTHSFREGSLFARVLESELVIAHPEDRPLLVRSVNGAPEAAAVPADEAGFTARRWVVRNLPAIEPEPFMPGLAELSVAPIVEATTYRDWSDFASWWWNLIRRELAMSEEMREILAGLVKDARSEEEMIRAVYDFVVSDIRYNAWEFGVHGYQPYNASTICARRFGDCKDKAIVIVTLLRELGIAAYPVVIHAAEPRPKEDLSLALVDHFNHCIAYAEPKGGEPRFLDGTAEYHDYSTLPDMDRGATVLLVRDGVPEIKTIPMPKPEENVHDAEYDVAIEADRSAIVSVKVRAEGTPAALERRLLQNPGRRREVIENQLIREFGSARYIESSAENVSRLTRGAGWSATAQVPEIVKRSGGSLSLPVTFRKTSLAQYATTDTRRFDLLLPTPSQRRRTVVYRLPEGLSPGELPPPVRLEGPFGRFSMVATAEGKTVRVETELALSRARVTPEEYPAFREFALAAFRATEQVVPLMEIR